MRRANGLTALPEEPVVPVAGYSLERRQFLQMPVPRLSLSSTGKVVYTLKTPYRYGTTQVAFDPVDFIARLAALIPKPRVNGTGTPSPATTASWLRITAGEVWSHQPNAVKE